MPWFLRAFIFRARPIFLLQRHPSALTSLSIDYKPLHEPQWSLGKAPGPHHKLQNAKEMLCSRFLASDDFWASPLPSCSFCLPHLVDKGDKIHLRPESTRFAETADACPGKRDKSVKCMSYAVPIANCKYTNGPFPNALKTKSS